MRRACASGRCRRFAHAVGVAALVHLAVALALPSALAQERAEPDYLDDRSTATQLVRSYFNAIERREYARAYSYWEPGAAATQLPPFEEFAAGYTDTLHVDIVLGEVQQDVGAGQLYYQVPVGITSLERDGAVRWFAGCYRAHLARPQLQAIPPFHPMSIQAATVWELADSPDFSDLLAGACAR